MIDVHADQDSPEGRAANTLAQLIVDADPEARSSGEVHISIVANLQCYGQSPQDVDITLLVSDRRTKPYAASDGTLIRGCCVTIELKSHSPRNVFFEGPLCFVRYNGEDHNVSSQSEHQKYSLINYIKANSSLRAPYTNNLIWLERLPASSLPTISSNLVGKDSTWQDFLDKISSLSDDRAEEIKNIHNPRHFFDLTKLLCKRLEPGSLDRNKMEIVARQVTRSDTQYLTLLGKQLLVFRGRGGTGKTVRLLQLGHQLYKDSQARVLLLTYNNALAADIGRLLALLRIQDSIGEKSISVKTVHKFMLDWLNSLELLEDGRDFLDSYDQYKSELLDYLSTGALQKEDVCRLKSDHSGDLSWDFILVDECQDWPADERDILYELYGHNRFILADGVDQLIRSSVSTDWREPIGTSDSQVVSLRKSLRLKSGLCDAVSELADVLAIPNWDLQPEPDIYGGKIIVLAGIEYSIEFHAEIIQSAAQSGNSPIDTLYCVPPSYVDVNQDGDRESTLAGTFHDWGHDVWDGASYSVRSSYPTSKQQLRVVQYDSCRGLEGWAVVCLSLDRFFEYKKATFEPTGESDLFVDQDEQAASFANRWIMIPLTRAIDTLVIHIEDENHPIAGTLVKVADKFPDIVEWRS